MKVSAFAGVAAALDLLRLAAQFLKALVLLLDHFELYKYIGGRDSIDRWEGRCDKNIKSVDLMDKRYHFKVKLYFKQQLVVIMRMLEVNEFNPARKRLKTPFLRRANHSPSFLKTNTHHKSCLLSNTKPHNFTYLQQLQAKTIEKSTHYQHASLDRQLVRKKSSLIELGLRYIHLQEKYASLLEKTNNLTCNTQPDFEECSNVDDRSRSKRKRLDRLKIIRVRLANIRLPHCFASPTQKGRWSRSLK